MLFEVSVKSPSKLTDTGIISDLFPGGELSHCKQTSFYLVVTKCAPFKNKGIPFLPSQLLYGLEELA